MSEGQPSAIEQMIAMYDELSRKLEELENSPGSGLDLNLVKQYREFVQSKENRNKIEKANTQRGLTFFKEALKNDIEGASPELAKQLEDIFSKYQF